MNKALVAFFYVMTMNGDCSFTEKETKALKDVIYLKYFPPVDYSFPLPGLSDF